jgi:tetratricopeptide (TPR) repeat protein
MYEVGMTDPGSETQISGAVTMVPPVPRYEDEEAETLGEKLAELYTRRDATAKKDAKLDAQIDATRRDLRRGPRLRPGEFLKDGRYRLIERMGDSAGSATWKAWDRYETRLVVVKEMVGPWVAKKMRVGSFLEAARTLQTIEHAGLARVHEASQSRDGFVYLATDYFEDGTLEDGWSGDTIDALQVVVEVGNAVSAAHAEDIVHARIWPNNIHFGLDGGAHLADFDLAGEHVSEERANVYVAPEAVERGQRATQASDVYSLAMCALFALNGGSLPYTVVRNPDRFIDGLDVAETVKDVLKRAVDWDTDTRYDSMTAFVDALLSDGTVLEALAARARDKARYVIASEHYTRLWALRPGESVAIKQILGEIYLRMAAWEEAFACLSTALEESTTPRSLFPLLREYAEGTGDWQRVADLLRDQAVGRSPVHRSAMHAELARILENQLSDPMGAAEAWLLVVEDHRLPERGIEALRALARLAEERNDWAAMVAHNQQLLPYLPEAERPQVQYAIGRAFVRFLDDEEAGLYWIDKAEAAGVQPLDMTQELQDLRARRGQWRRVIALMRLEADHETKVHNASRILLRAATIARSVHLDPEAEAIYENMLERAPQHYPAQRELARMRHRAGHDERARETYATLVEAYDGKAEKAEASERAADHTAYAGLLIDIGRFEDALEQLEAALSLQSDNCEALKLAGPLYLDMGRLEEGARVLEQNYSLFKAVKTHGERLDAAIQRADAAWFRGRLAVAMRWYNTVLDTVPEHAEAWWGLAKVALAARGGHPGADRAPWLANTPDRFTPQEALARLFLGLFTGEALSDWLSRHPLGNGVADAGATSGRLACAAVDLLTRYGCVDADLFNRLADAYPHWERRIRAVETLWVVGDPDFRFARSYRWAGSALERDFSKDTHRIVLPLGDPIHGRLVVDFGTPEHWSVLIGTEEPEPSELEMPEEPRVFEDESPNPAVEFLLGETVEFEMPSGAWEARIGSEAGCDWVVPGLDPVHAWIVRRGRAVYIQAADGSELSVDGEAVPGWRLHGGETVQLGSNLWDIRTYIPEPDDEEEDDALPVRFEDFPDTADPTWEGAHPRGAKQGPLASLAAEETFVEPLDDVHRLAMAETDAGQPSEMEPDDASEDAPADPAVQPLIPEHVPGPTLSVMEESGAEPEPASEEVEIAAEVEDEVPAPAPPSAAIDMTEYASEPLDPAVFEASSDDDEFEFKSADTEEGLADEGEDLEDSEDLDDDSADPDDSDDPDDEATVGPAVDAPAEPSVLSFEDDVPTTTASRSEVLEKLAAADREAPASVQDDYEDAVVTQIQQNPLRGTAFLDPPAESEVDEDSLGPAGDAPTPQWVVDSQYAQEEGAEPQDEVATMAQLPALSAEAERHARLVGPPDDPYTAPNPVSDVAPIPSESDEAEAPEPPEAAPEDDGIWHPEIIEHGAAAEPEDLASLDAVEPTGDPEVHDDTPDEPAVAAPETTAVLEIMSGPARGTQVEVVGVVALGRDEACEVYLPADPMLAPLHCRFVHTDGNYLVMDNGTDRGTVVNGTRVSEAILSGGETIMVGSTVLRFQVQRGG